jgi:mutual gliding-motility protein MglA
MVCAAITRPGRRLPSFLKVQAQLVTGVTLLAMARIWYKTKEQAKKSADCQIYACALFAHGNRVQNVRRLGRVLSFINFAAREINCKIVYYGAGLGGKTTNLQYIYQKTAEQQKGKMISLATETERTLFFDFLPLDLGSVRGFKTRIHLYTVPGQVFYDASRKLILRGVDGIVFVADSQQERMDANAEALDNLMSNLKEHGYDFNKIPYVLQLNKRDLPNILPVDTLTKELRRKDEPVLEAVAFQGQGVFETLKEIARQVLVELKKGS